MTVEVFRNRSPYRARSMRKGGQWSPAFLGPYSWYDAHAGGSATQITDSSSHGRAAATFGATTAAPLWLPYTGTPYVHLEAATAGTNSISCTAPANTASYSAVPLGGGAATTGAAASGAFTFTTAGDWQSISLLDGSTVELARFNAADCTQTAMTDTYAVAWTVNRGTAGRQTVVLSPAAKSDRSTILFDGVNDYADVPAAAWPPMNTTDTAAIVVVFRRHGNPGTGTPAVVNNKANITSTTKGFYIRRSASAASTTFEVYAADGAAADVATAAPAFTTRAVLTCHVSPAPRAVVTQVNNAAENIDATKAAGDATSGIDGYIGRVATTYMAMEFEALLMFNRALTTAEIAQIVDYYRGGV